MRIFVIITILMALSTSTLLANTLNFRGLYGDEEVLEKPYRATLLRDQRAIRYQTEAMDLIINEGGGVFNGRRFTWKDDDNMIGIFANSLESTQGDYSGLANPGIYVTDKDNMISLVSSTQKAEISFHVDHIKVHKKSRCWLLIVPFPSSSTTTTVELNSVEAYENKLLKVLKTLVEEQLVTFEMDYQRASEVEADVELAEKVSRGSFNFELELEKMKAKRKKIFETEIRDRLVLSFYKACQDTLTFDQLKSVKRVAFETTWRDYMVYEWAIKRDLSVDQVLDARKQIFSTDCRDNLVMNFIQRHNNQLSQDALKRLRRACFHSHNRDAIALMMD